MSSTRHKFTLNKSTVFLVITFYWFLYSVSCFSSGLPWKQNDFSSGVWMPQFSGNVLYYPFDEGAGTIAYDDSGYNNTGTLRNGPVYVDGKVGKALKFDGVNDDVYRVTNSSISPTNAITYAAWVKLTADKSSSYLYIFEKWSSYLLRIDPGNIFRAYINYNNTTWYQANYTFTPALNTWYHLAGTYDKDGGSIKLYIDGEFKGQAALTYSIYTTGDLRIGNTLEGIIDEVRIYNRALTADEIKQLLLRAPNVFSNSGIYASSDYDCAETFTLGKISWNMDVPPGCSVTLTVSTESSQSALGSTWLNTTVITPSNSNSDTGLNVTPRRWIKYRAIVSIPSGISASITFKEIKLTPAVQGITTTSNGSATAVLKLNTQLRFDMDFNVDMSQSKSCSITIKTEGGGTVGPIKATWQNSRKFVSDPYTIGTGTGNGFADVYLTGARTSAASGDQPLYYYYPRCFIVDTADIVSVGKTAFFPDPFSPNSDGKAEETSLFFSLSTPQEVILRIYTLKGTLVRSLKENETLQGNVEIRWDGKDDSGKLSPIGVYLYSLRTGTQVKNGTVVLSK